MSKNSWQCLFSSPVDCQSPLAFKHWRGEPNTLHAQQHAPRAPEVCGLEWGELLWGSILVLFLLCSVYNSGEASLDMPEGSFGLKLENRESQSLALVHRAHVTISKISAHGSQDAEGCLQACSNEHVSRESSCSVRPSRVGLLVELCRTAQSNAWTDRGLCCSGHHHHPPPCSGLYRDRPQSWECTPHLLSVWQGLDIQGKYIINSLRRQNLWEPP